MKKIRIIDDKKQWLPIYCVANLFLIQYLESHSTWVRELKFPMLVTLSGMVKVALHVSAWVEMCCRGWCANTAHCRTPRECVSWNILIIRWAYYAYRRTPRECVSWNIPPEAFAQWNDVALHVSAWVEIPWRVAWFCNVRSHSTWVRELKSFFG